MVFARVWVNSWNSHDLDRILSHYTEDFEMTSPFIVKLMKEPAGAI
jgi:ketosteroid isomerase-like protein